MKLSELAEKEIIIYGTGYVGHKFLRVLQEYGLDHRVRCFAVTRKPEKELKVDGIPVCDIGSLPLNENTLICLAVHDSLREEVERAVKKRTEQYMWIYPKLYEWLLGEAEQTNVQVEVGSILKNYKEDVRLAVRLAAIEQQEGKNSVGFDYYIRAQMLHCDEYTARKRLKRFRKLVTDWETLSPSSIPPLSLNRDYEMIDGNHRLSLAVYYGQKKILCNIYPTKLRVEEIHDPAAMMKKITMKERCFNLEEMQKLEEIQERYVMCF